MSRYQKIINKNNNVSSNNDENEVYYAKFMRRVQAALIDLILFSLILVILFGQSNIISDDGVIAKKQYDLLKEKYASGEITEKEFREKSSAITTREVIGFFIRSLSQMLISIFFILPFWIYKSTTPGKMAMSMIIVDEETLKPMTKKQCILRYIGYIVSFACIFIGFFVILFSKKKQGWHDKIAHTVVIHTKNLDSEEEKNKKFKRDTILFFAILLFLFASKFFR